MIFSNELSAKLQKARLISASQPSEIAIYLTAEACPQRLAYEDNNVSMRVFFRVTVLLLFSILTATSFAQSSKASKGLYIVSAETKVPIHDVSVQAEGFSAVSDENGFVSLKNLPATASQLVISISASETLSSKATIISPKLNLNYKASEKVQLYLYNGRGFHSNDTRVAVQQVARRCCRQHMLRISVGFQAGL